MTGPHCTGPTSDGRCISADDCAGACKHAAPADQECASLAATLTAVQARIAALGALNRQSLAQLARAQHERDLAIAELTSARIELERLRAISATYHVTNCARCGRSIRCDEPREQLPGAVGYFRHALGCPTQGPTVRNSDATQGATDSPPNPGAGPREEHP